MHVLRSHGESLSYTALLALVIASGTNTAHAKLRSTEYRKTQRFVRLHSPHVVAIQKPAQCLPVSVWKSRYGRQSIAVCSFCVASTTRRSR